MARRNCVEMEAEKQLFLAAETSEQSCHGPAGCVASGSKGLGFFWLPPEPETAPTSRNPNQNRAAHGRIFSSNKSAPASRQTGFYANRDPKKQEVGFIFA